LCETGFFGDSEARAIVALLLAAGAEHSIRDRKSKPPGDYVTDETIAILLVVTPMSARI